MNIDIDEADLKTGLLGLVVALVEIVRDALRLQALHRMEAGSLTDAEVERLGEALLELDTAIDLLKEEQGIGQAVQSVRDGLDRVVDDVLGSFFDSQRWSDALEEAASGVGG